MMDDERDARIAALEAQIKGLRQAMTDADNDVILAHQARETAETALAAMTKERDEALHFLDVAVDKSPEPLKKLGKHLASLLDEDDWPTAERLLNGAATALAAERAKTAKLVEAGNGLHSLVEGIQGAMQHGTWRDEKGQRLKDTPEWVAFYNARAAITEAGQ